MPYQVTKHYGHEAGLSCCFRQPRATGSHCSKLHGYALAFTFVFESNTLDNRNWVVDFGGLKLLKKSLHSLFDHTTAVDQHDPEMPAFQAMHDAGLIDMVVFDLGVGCERFAQKGFSEANKIIAEVNRRAVRYGWPHRVRVVSCSVSEHGGNMATYINPNPEPVE